MTMQDEKQFHAALRVQERIASALEHLGQEAIVKRCGPDTVPFLYHKYNCVICENLKLNEEKPK